MLVLACVVVVWWWGVWLAVGFLVDHIVGIFVPPSSTLPLTSFVGSFFSAMNFPSNSSIFTVLSLMLLTRDQRGLPSLDDSSSVSPEMHIP